MCAGCRWKGASPQANEVSLRGATSLPRRLTSFASGLGGSAGAQRVVRVLSRLAAWTATEGLPLDPEVVLDPDTVERFIAVGGRQQGQTKVHDFQRAANRCVLAHRRRLHERAVRPEPDPLGAAPRLSSASSFGILA